MGKMLNIALVEPSEVVAEGLTAMLHKTGKTFQLTYFFDFSTFSHKQRILNFQVVIINPVTILNLETEWNKFIEKNPTITRIALIYNYYTSNAQTNFHHFYYINHSIHELVKMLTKTETKPTTFKAENNETLTKREKEILCYLSKGKSIKEIAEIIHLSPFTVLTHRKNISSKTGIKTLAGLTVYAISLGLINIDEMSE